MAKRSGRSAKNRASEIIAFTIGVRGWGKSEPVQFALLKTAASAAPTGTDSGNGERLRIGNGVDAATFRLVLDVVRR